VKFRIIFLYLIIGFFSNCTNESDEIKFPVKAPDPCDAVKFSTHIKPIIDVYCSGSSCHGSDAIDSFTSYNRILPYILDTQLRIRLLEKMDMPKLPNPPLTQQQLDYFKCWLDRGGMNN